MKIKIEDLLERKDALDKVLAKDLPFKLAYRLNKMASKFVLEIKHIERIRSDMFKMYGAEQEDGSIKLEDKKKTKKFKDEWAKFIEDEIDFDVELIPFEILEKGNVSLSAYDISNLDIFLAEPIKDEKPKKNQKKKR